ncbi:MAG: efflux RND transporter periplasmic adaptor subunit [Pseudomonadota bacterium]|jgi:membrane fusion protein (multidrug efflux system)
MQNRTLKEMNVMKGKLLKGLHQKKQQFQKAVPEEKRKLLFQLLGASIAGITVLVLLYYVLIGSKHITTDNAYVAGDIAQISAAVAGTIKEVHCKDTDVVKAGDVLVTIDDTDAKLAFIRAQAELDKAQTDCERAKIDYERRLALVKTGSVSAEEITNAKNAFSATKAVFQAAEAVFKQAQVDLARTIVRSPVDGVVAKRQVQLGQRVQPGFMLLSVVPSLELYVNANFKEVQLRKVKVGQPVKLMADFYGSSVKYHGKVAGIAGGTGAAFAVIPAQNATGNWIKVVQRLPVRIELDPEELKKHPLQVGLSMLVDIDVSD